MKEKIKSFLDILRPQDEMKQKSTLGMVLEIIVLTIYLLCMLPFVSILVFSLLVIAFFKKRRIELDNPHITF